MSPRARSRLMIAGAALATLCAISLFLKNTPSQLSPNSEPAGVAPSSDSSTEEVAVTSVGTPRELQAPAHVENNPASTKSIPERAVAEPEAPSSNDEELCQVDGLVIDEEGSPVAGAVVWADDEVPMSNAVVTDDDGSYVLRLPPGRHEIRACSVNRPVASIAAVVTDDNVQSRARPIVLEVGGTIHGVIRDRDGKPVSRVRFHCYVPERARMAMPRGTGALYINDYHTKSNEQGEFSFGGLGDAEYRVEPVLYMSPDYATTPERYTDVRPGGPRIEFLFHPAAEVEGLVLDDATGQAIEEFEVNWREVKSQDGRFRRAIRAGEEVEVNIYARGYLEQTKTVSTATLADSERPLEFRLVRDDGAATLVITITGESEQPIADVAVQGSAWDHRIWKQDAKLGSSPIEIQNIIAGKHDVMIWAPSHELVYRQVDLEIGSRHELEVQLRRGGPVNLQILSRDKTVVDFARFGVATVEKKDIAWRFQGDDGDSMIHFGIGKEPGSRSGTGSGVITGLPAGDFLLLIHPPGGEPPFEFPFHVDVGPTDLMIMYGAE
ncbi:MAG: carboxypeptidase-like regulatory domain-containing protein [Planctomycetes bacterium]|nr:carboxypeptidase-like regulatory domain-containing protein [Planctomycetota bacterium]